MSLSLGDSRFSNIPRQDQPVSDFSVADIVAATKNEVPFIESVALRFDKVLGHGTTFQVAREIYNNPGGLPYFVAVKRLLPRPDAPNNTSKRYAGVLRELRVLTHPPIRSHGCISQVIGYGWSDLQSHGVQPYLVMDFSDHGTIIQYLKRCRIPIHERRELALDIAAALKAVHECGIVHGDVKAENVLVFDNNTPFGPGDEYITRPQVARLADFSSTVFEQDFVNQPEVYYFGTETYLAPEIAGRPACRYMSDTRTFDLFKLADCYSFGLLLWEVIQNGKPFHDSIVLGPGETLKGFVDKISGNGRDELGGLALSLCDTLDEVRANAQLVDAVKKTIFACLRDDPSQRCTMDEAVLLLADGTSIARPQLVHPLPMSSPPPQRSAASENRQLVTRQPGQQSVYTLVPVTSENLIVRQVKVAEHDWPVVGTSDPLVYIESGTDVGAFAFVDLDMFKTAMVDPPPPQTQQDLANQIQNSIGHQNDETKKAHLHLQLAVTYHIGYGLEPDCLLVLHHLRAASNANSVARALLPAVSQALAMDEKDAEPDTTSNHYLPLKASFGSSRMVQDDTCNLASTLNALKISLTIQDQTMLIEALTAACREADFDAAKLVARSCTTVMTGSGKPNPFHWLITFVHAQAKELFHILSQHKAEYSSLLAHDSGPPVYFPHQCMELFGTPLHWATRAGNLELVTLLIEYGADVNIRWQSRAPGAPEVPLLKYQPSYSPLDLAVAYHFSDIVKVLLQAGSPTSGGSIEWTYTPFHLIGMRTMPFARFAAHGERSRLALRNTIHALKAHGLDINAVDSESDTPLTLAVRSIDIEPYILEELLDAGAGTCSAFEALHGNVVIRASRFCSDRLGSGWKTRLLLPLVEDLNALDPEGISAMHYCAVLGDVSTAMVLLDTKRVNTANRSLAGHTALTIAALSGSASVIECLVEAGGDLELPDGSGYTALAGAVLQRKLEASVALIRAGANVSWAKHNVLHLAVTNASQRPSIVQELLNDCPEQLCKTALLNGFDQMGWTPMQRAAYFGDVDGVDALLDAGADHLTFKHPAYMSMGGTPLQVVTKFLERLKNNGGELGPDHKAVKEKGPLAVRRFMNCLYAIRGRLESC
ncbi:ankyrin [Rhypophila decipiens]